MTLSRWLRDYLYIPLGGGRGSRWTVARNIMITMVLGGLWHGAAWTFVAWGAIHGIGQVVGHIRRSRPGGRGTGPRARRSGPDLGPAARHLPHRVPGLDLLPRRLHLDRAHHDPAGSSRPGARAPLVTPLVVITVVGAVGVAVPPARARGPGPARARPSTLGGARGHTGGRASRHHDTRATRCRAVHLLQVLRPVPEGSAFGFRGSGGRFRACTCTRGPHDRHSR